MRKIKWFPLLLSMMLLFCLTACGNNDENIEFYKTDVTTYEIDNYLCPLQYAEQWKDFTAVEVTEYADACEVNFTAVLEEKNISLFSFMLCDQSDEGDLLGVLDTELGEKKVYLINRFDEQTASELSAKARDQYYRMCEDVNVTISKLVYDNNMTLV